METMIGVIKGESAVSVSEKIRRGPRGVGLYIRRAERNRRLALEELLSGKGTYYTSALMAQGFYTAAANAYTECCSAYKHTTQKLDNKYVRHLLRRSREMHRKSGIMWLKLQRTWEGAEQLRVSNMPEAQISQLANRHIVGPVLL